MKQYLLRLVTTALICAVIQTFHQQGTAKALTKLVSGLIMTMTVITPLKQLSFPASIDFSLSLSDEAYISASEGEEMLLSALSHIIKAETEAYIQDKADGLGIRIKAYVSLSHEEIPTPESVRIQGTVTDENRGRLQEILCTDLGIAKENITWIC